MSTNAPTRPVALRGFTLKKANPTSATVTVGTAAPEAVGAGDVILLDFCSKQVLNG